MPTLYTALALLAWRHVAVTVYGTTLPPSVLAPDEDLMMESRSAEAELRAELKSRAVVREKVAPTLNISGLPKVPLKLSLSVLSVVRVDDAREQMMTAVSVEMDWRDVFLAWDPSQHCGLSQTQLPVSAVWTPDLRVLNSYDQAYLLGSTQALRLNSSGHIKIVSPGVITSSCTMDLMYYPYDEQKCSLLFYSFTNNLDVTTQIDRFQSEQISSSLNLSNEWDLINVTIREFKITESDEAYPELTLLLRRKTAFYTVCLVIPMVLTSYMNTLVFLLPLQAGEKVSYLVTMVVSTSVFVSYFSEVMPRGLTNIPNLMKLLLGVNVESLLILLATLLVLYQHNHPASSPAALSAVAPASRTDTSKNGRGSDTKSSAEDIGKSKDSLVVSEGVMKVEVRSRRRMKAAALDKIFFVVFITGNTVFLLFLLLVAKE